MKIPDFYEYRWAKTIKCRKDYENSKEKLDYLRKEYEIWALWIEKFYNGEYGIYKTLTGDAPRYAVEYYMDFCYWKNTYGNNYLKRDHFANHKVRALYIIELLESVFKKVDKYVLRSKDVDEDEDTGFNLNFQEMKEKMMIDPTYKQKWFKAAYEANDYITKLLYSENIRTNDISGTYNTNSNISDRIINNISMYNNTIRSKPRSTSRSKQRKNNRSKRRNTGRSKRRNTGRSKQRKNSRSKQRKNSRSKRRNTGRSKR